MKKSTQELLSLIQNTENIELYLKENETELISLSLDDYLQLLLEKKHLKISDVMNRSQQSDYVYKVFKNQRKASRDILIAIALGMECKLDEAQTLLRIASQARLDPRNQRDAVFIYALLHHLSVMQVNEVLYDLGVGLI
ncbi:MAG: XRE family transcriptional regulator [Roseburia sp.]|nr:XRE family transcriptional regulator [Roseburia sp.]